MARLHKVVLYVTDVFGEYFPEDLKEKLENIKNLSVHVSSAAWTEVGEWHDDHELNKRGCDRSKYFEKKEIL